MKPSERIQKVIDILLDTSDIGATVSNLYIIRGEVAKLEETIETSWKKVSHLQAILGVLNTDNEIASLHNYELWSIHGDLQKTIEDALLPRGG